MLLVIAATSRELGGVEEGARVVCGIGPAAAAAATTEAIEQRAPTALLHVGIAGARRSAGLPILATVLGSESIDCDDPVAPVLTPDPALLAAAQSAFPDAIVTAIGTSATVGGTHATTVEAMEGHAVLAAAARAAVPAIEVRIVSNEVEEPDRALWHFDEAFARLEIVTRRLREALAGART